MKKIASAAPFFSEQDIENVLSEVKSILRSKRLVLGQYTRKFEELFSRYVGTKHGIAVSSATAALEIVLKYYKAERAEVLIPTNTFIACPNTVLYAGGKPVFVDLDPNSFCLDIGDVRNKVTSKTKVIMAVHLGGLPDPAMHDLMEMCSERGIILIEDCSHAHGAGYKGKKVGSLGSAGCFSFFATKIMTTGTGGMITTDDPNLKSFAEALRHQGGIGGEGQIEVFDKLGYDWMMSEITAAMGISQLENLDSQLEKRRLIASWYEESLAENGKVRTLPKFDGITSSYWKYIVVLDRAIDRDKVRSILRTNFNIDAGILYPTLCHMQPVYQQLGYKKGECPVGEEIIQHQLTLPINPYMTEEDVNLVAENLHRVMAMDSVHA